MITFLFILIMIAMLLCILIVLFGKEDKKGFIIFLIPLSIAESLLFYCTDDKDDHSKISTFTETPVVDNNTVYICTGETSKKYHKTADCRWLDNCSGTIKEVSIEEAEEKHKTPCKGCYKQ